MTETGRGYLDGDKDAMDNLLLHKIGELCSPRQSNRLDCVCGAAEAFTS